MKVDRCLRLIQNDKLSRRTNNEEILEKDGSVSVHHINIQGLTVERPQVNHGEFREIVTDIFAQVTQEWNFRKNRDCTIPSVNTVFHGYESTSYYGPKNRSGENKSIYFSKQFQKRNQELGMTKLPLQASQETCKWCWFSSMMSSCIFNIRSIN